MIVIRKKYDNISESILLDQSLSTRMNLPKEDPGYLPSVDLNKIKNAYKDTVHKLYGAFPTMVSMLEKKDVIIAHAPELFIGTIPTMCTDGISIIIDPYFANWLLDLGGHECFMFVLVHECFHILFDHCKEEAEYAAEGNLMDALRANEAQDYEINYAIENFMWLSRTEKLFSPGITKKCKGLYNELYGKKTMSWEEIYADLERKRRETKKKTTTPKWKEAFKRGFDERSNKLREEGKIK